MPIFVLALQADGPHTIHTAYLYYKISPVQFVSISDGLESVH